MLYNNIFIAILLIHAPIYNNGRYNIVTSTIIIVFSRNNNQFVNIDVEKQITFHGYKEDYMKRLDKMIQIVKPYADQENNNEGHSEELFDELD